MRSVTDRVPTENTGKNGAAREDETELYSGAVAMFHVKVLRHHNIMTGFLAAGITAPRRIGGG